MTSRISVKSFFPAAIAVGFLCLSATRVVFADDATNTTPENVVNAVFTAARTGDVGKLSLLCDPAGTGDGDVKDICAVKNVSEKDFAVYFKNGKISGTVKTDGMMAEIPILFGPDGTKPETMMLKKVGDKWYLESF